MCSVARRTISAEVGEIEPDDWDNSSHRQRRITSTRTYRVAAYDMRAQVDIVTKISRER